MPYESVRWHTDVTPLNREEAMLQKQMDIATLIRTHRVRGHLIADLDPLRWKEPKMHAELDPATYGLTIWDLDRVFRAGGVAGAEEMKLGDLLHVLRDAYCRTIGVEYMHIQHSDEQRWIQSQLEGVQVRLSPDELRRLLERLNAAEAFEKFLATKYVGTKRFGLEGAESAIPILDSILSAAADGGLDEVVIGMTHRGRLNVLANIVGKSYDQIFKEFEGHVDPELGAGVGRRQVPPRRLGQVREPVRAATSASSWRRTRATSRRSTRSCSGWPAPSRTRSSRPDRSPCCRSSSTATPPSPARASWPSASR